MASRLVAAAARQAAAASRGARAAVARHDSAAASRAARLAEVAASRAARLAAAAASCAARSKRRPGPPLDVSDRLSFRYSSEPLDDGKCVAAKDVESDEAVWALYERFCKSYKLKRDHAEMARRFEIFKFNAEVVHNWNSYVHKDLHELAEAKKQRDLGLGVGDWFLQKELHTRNDGGDTLDQHWQNFLKSVNEGKSPVGL